MDKAALCSSCCPQTTFFAPAFLPFLILAWLFLPLKICQSPHSPYSYTSHVCSLESPSSTRRAYLSFYQSNDESETFLTTAFPFLLPLVFDAFPQPHSYRGTCSFQEFQSCLSSLSWIFSTSLPTILFHTCADKLSRNIFTFSVLPPSITHFSNRTPTPGCIYLAFCLLPSKKPLRFQSFPL